MSEKFHAWYSEKSAKMHGYAVYSKEDGTLVNCTLVVKEEHLSSINYDFDDTKYVGKVVKYVKRVEGVMIGSIFANNYLWKSYEH